MGAMASQITQSFTQAQMKKTLKVHVIGHWAGNSPVTGEFPAQMASDAEYVSIWWRHHESKARKIHISRCVVKKNICEIKEIVISKTVASHLSDVIMSVIATPITSVSNVCPGANQQRSTTLAFFRGIHRLPVTSPHKRPVTRKMFPFDHVIMFCRYIMHFRTQTFWGSLLKKRRRNLRCEKWSQSVIEPKPLQLKSAVELTQISTYGHKFQWVSIWISKRSPFLTAGGLVLNYVT